MRPKKSSFSLTFAPNKHRMKEDQGLAPVPPLVPEINDRFYKHDGGKLDYFDPSLSSGAFPLSPTHRRLPPFGD